MQYYIQGSKKNAAKIYDAFRRIGAVNALAFSFVDNTRTFFTYESGGKIFIEAGKYWILNKLLSTHQDYKKLKITE